MVNDSFLTRWSKRKLESEKEDSVSQSADKKAIETQYVNNDPETAKENVCLGNSPVETMDSCSASETVSNLAHHADSGSKSHEEAQTLASLLTSEADREIKKAALRKLFLGGEFSEVCRMNDYAQDFSSIKPLSPEVAQTLRGWLKESTENSEQQGELLTENQPAMDEIIDGSTGSETDLDSLDQAESIENEIEPLAEHSQFEGETKNTI
ncbi:DUF3306 domain-containing protein [Vibrio ziniensis]|uniref:DUF3306 domain-containing protein n=1 Tax=Vibrio ziniensis TaxID=2711221 RepID=A0A6G7CI31_9VIBR|nr:DUF3306 domain-containing protein [Vibrio ziniensis]QIH41801.1 DUF3306 domain-containing protein [Vibrio ziniensis]